LAKKKKKVEFGVGHARLTEDVEKLTKAHKDLETNHSTLTKSREQLKIRLSQFDVPSTATSTL
jgi:cellobiose phosphorylase